MLFFKPNLKKLAKKRDVVRLLHLLASSKRELRNEAKYYLELNDLRRAAIPHLIRALSDPSVSADAAELLGRHRAMEAIDSLVSALKSSDPQTRRQAAAALSNMQYPNITYKDIQPLLDAALGSDLDIRRDAVRAIYECRDPRSLEALCANVTDSEVGQYAVIGLRELRDPRAVGVLTRALSSGHAGLWEHAAQALAAIGNDAALAALLHYARSTDMLPAEILSNIADFEMEPATDFLVEQGHWHYLWPKHKLLVLLSRDRCRRVAELIARSISGESHSRLESYELLTAILRQQGAAVDEETLRMIDGLQPPKAGRADGAGQVAADRGRAEAYQRLLEATSTELRRRSHP